MPEWIKIFLYPCELHISGWGWSASAKGLSAVIVVVLLAIIITRCSAG
jgi:hypothetical protein